MKLSKILAIVFAPLIILSSCKKDFLEVDNTGALYRQIYVKDLNTMGHFMTGIYVMLNGVYEHGIGAAYPELVADNLKPLASGVQSMVAAYAWNQQATETQQYYPTEQSLNMNGSWTYGYQIIRACSFVIEDVDKYRNENPSKADDLKGQAHAIRAMVHFKLINIFAQPFKFSSDGSHAGIPYIKTSDITESYSRQSVAKGYDEMVADLTNAVNLLPANITDTRNMNVAAAKALLARVYLFKEDYDNALSLAEEISTQFPLLTIANGYPGDLFKHKSPNESEILYRLTPIALSAAGTSQFLGLWLYANRTRYTATNDIANILLENLNDIRSTWVIDKSGLWAVNKYPLNAVPEITPSISLPATAYYPPVIRSSEMFLTVAEAAARKSDENKARTYLNAIRQRADPTSEPVVATGAALMDSIFKERRKELAFEGLRMYDLQRWKLGVSRSDGFLPGSITLPFPSTKAISPIPRLDVTISGIPQNPDY